MKDETIHGYVMARLLGIGTFGEVWEAKAPGGFRAAVKLIRKRGSMAEARLELNALEALKNLDHLHLLKTFSAWDDPDRVVIAMELANGTLRQRLTYCRQHLSLMGIPPDELLHYFREAADALDYLHTQRPPKFHRDVKPDNILLFTNSNPPHVKLGDCGLLREQSEQGNVIMQMSTAGTPPYIAPEVWSRKTLPQSDQYSLAIAYVELRMGYRPIEADSPHAMAAAHTFYVPRLDGLEEAEKQVIAKALAKEPTDRFRSCAELVDELEKSLGLTGQRFRPSRPLELSQNPLLAQYAEEKSSVSSDLSTAAPPPTQRDSGTPPHSLASLRSGSITDPEVQLPNVGWKGKADQPKPGGSGGRGGRGGIVLGIVALGVFVLAVGGWGAWYFRPDGNRKDRDKDKDKDKPVATKVEVGGTRAFWLAAGGKREFTLTVDPPEAAEKLEVKVLDAADLDLRPEARRGSVGITATAGKIAPGKRAVRLQLVPKQDANLELTGGAEVALDVHLLPEGFQPETDRLEGSPPAYGRIVRRLEGEAVVFRLIRPKQGELFYVMENKVWNSLFGRFASQSPNVLDGATWKRGGVADGKDVAADGAPELPVLRVRRDEAGRFATWLGGRLPTAAQLDVAAGLGQQTGRDGPAAGDNVAVRRRLTGPRSVRDPDSEDVSPAGVRDLAGNGREWTRDDLRDDDGSTLAVLRGQSYTAAKPLSYAALQEQKDDRGLTPTQYPDRASPYTGFRVVVELSAPR